MKKTNIYAGIIVIMLVILGGLMFVKKERFFATQKGAEITQTVAKGRVSLTINNGEEDPLIVNNEFKEGMTVFDLLKETTEELGLSLEIKTFDFGISVEAIGDKKNGQDQNYWLYYVNNEMPMVSCDKKEIKVEDKIEFKFEKSTF